MKTLLRLDASIRTTESYTRTLTDYFEAAWLKANPGGNIIRRCLIRDSIPHLTQEALDNFATPYDPSSGNTLSDQLISELRHANHVVIGSPLYNLSLPSSLKAYFDHVVRLTATFEVVDGQYRGLLENVSATLITARSSISSTDYVDDFQTSYLKAVLNFIGIDSIEVVALQATGLENEKIESSLSTVKQMIDGFFATNKELEWAGIFSDSEKDEISTIRSAQASAIIEGNAELYAELCTDDIKLLIPSRDAVCGIEAFTKTEKELFSGSKFDRFIKHPIRIERSGDLAVEVGRQYIEMRSQNENEGVFSASQKYTHVFRKTGNGWRFSVLMSNPS